MHHSLVYLGGTAVGRKYLKHCSATHIAKILPSCLTKSTRTVYCLLVNRTHFQREQLTQGHQQSVCSTRALFCELIANRILRRFHEDNAGAQGLLLLSQILVGGFDPFQGAPADVVAESSQLSWTIQMRSGYRRKLPALEIAIISESKVFLSVSKLHLLIKFRSLGLLCVIGRCKQAFASCTIYFFPGNRILMSRSSQSSACQYVLDKSAISYFALSQGLIYPRFMP